MIKNGIELEVKIDNWRNILYNFIKTDLKKCEIDENLINKILIACEEIYVNISNYAYLQTKIGKIKVLMKFSKEEVNITFIDDGISFNPILMPNPDIKSNLIDRRIGGWGIFIVKNLMDEMKYKRKNGKNYLTITKFLNCGGKNDAN